ncbi:MAG: AP2 domain-containing protein [Desulfobacteraceae bacterium]|nr:MAG: AP2 domain-containing protein [Desulfobacteraceae bacterium]
MSKLDLRNERFGRLIVIGDSGFRFGNQKAVAWLCLCDCGRVRKIITGDLRQNRTKSCGCLNRELSAKRWFKHGEGKTKLYRLWRGIKTRCLDKGSHAYHRYGGRGIKICKDWLDFILFKKWALKSGYKEGLSIDRKDNNGNYEPKNCQWLTLRENSLKWWQMDRLL